MVPGLSRFSVGQTAKVLGIMLASWGLLRCRSSIDCDVLTRGGRAECGVRSGDPDPLRHPGFVFTAIGCAVYNWVAGKVGGIEIALDSAVGSTG